MGSARTTTSASASRSPKATRTPRRPRCCATSAAARRPGAHRPGTRTPAHPAPFPAHLTGFAHLAEHADPCVRALVARDPGTEPAVVERLTRDPDPEDRAALARHPHLPAPGRAALLTDPELAHAAAANPALHPATADRLVHTHGRGPW
ncbi:hypothetical protein [Streptomyces sp. NPDC004658]|uniref:hypothetical protein n=1 Tax=Streptomyces sp. NPDC004658 TaxID=3154672 RepID=UPI0033B3BD00